ncbi:MAG TPA: hypothetical protein VLZ72_07850, partial [Flavobacterium sp.]|nr:hypothetical protein [Flavobacterium sp.]
SLSTALLAKYYTPLCNMLKRPTHKQHIWFLPTRKANAEKPKELFLANARTENETEKSKFRN